MRLVTKDKLFERALLICSLPALAAYVPVVVLIFILVLAARLWTALLLLATYPILYLLWKASPNPRWQLADPFDRLRSTVTAIPEIWDRVLELCTGRL